jgi:hypothetical protein
MRVTAGTWLVAVAGLILIGLFGWHSGSFRVATASPDSLDNPNTRTVGAPAHRLHRQGPLSPRRSHLAAVPVDQEPPSQMRET